MSEHIQALLAQFVPCQLQVNLDKLTCDVRKALPDLAEAMRGMNILYRRQIGEHVKELGEYLEQQGMLDTIEGQAFLHFNGPYNKLQGGAAFIDGLPETLPGKALYPPDISREEVNAYIEANPDQRNELLSPYTVVVRDGNCLKCVPYHIYFAKELMPVAKSLRKAATHLAPSNALLARFLEGRAAALTGERNLPDSDADWVRLHLPPLEVVIGPFEVYEDHLMGVKAFYEGMLLATDYEHCKTLATIEQALPSLAEMIPCPADAKPAVGGMAPMIVADELMATGEARSGLMAAAFNLPNDPGVRGKFGWKQIMIRNVMQAKFENCTLRIAARMFNKEDLTSVTFEGFFFHVLLHEVTHGLGPAYRSNGRTIGESCGPHATTLEETKADIGSLTLLLANSGQFGIPSLSPYQIGLSYLAGLFRSIRFGLFEAHGRANVIQYNALTALGAIAHNEDGRFFIVTEHLESAAKNLLARIIDLQAQGSEEEIAAFLAQYATPPQELISAVESLSDLPIDIQPFFSL